MVSIDPAACPHEVRPAVMVQHWDQLTFLHWPYEPAAVQRVLPEGLTVEERDGAAWVGLVPFLMRVALARGPAFATFCETNVRTYVRDAGGRPGIWFMSLDAAHLPAVVTARATYGLPYYWSRMSLVRTESTVRYHCRRRWPGPVRPASTVTTVVGEAIHPDDLTAFEHFLTARWLLYSARGRRRRLARAWHVPWPLHRGQVTALHDELIAAGGLPPPEGEPLVHYSPGVRVRIGLPQRLGVSLPA